MEIVRPTRQPIRRTFTPGVSLEYIASPNEMSFFAKINSVQVREKGKPIVAENDLDHGSKLRNFKETMPKSYRFV